MMDWCEGQQRVVQAEELCQRIDLVLEQATWPDLVQAVGQHASDVSSRWVPVTWTRRQEGIVPYAGSARSRVALGRADRPRDTESPGLTKSDSARPPAAAPIDPSLDVGRSAAPRRPRPAAICRWRPGVPSLVVPERTPVVLPQRTEPVRSLNLLHVGDDRVGFRHNFVEAEPAVAVRLGLCFF